MKAKICVILFALILAAAVFVVGCEGGCGGGGGGGGGGDDDSDQWDQYKEYCGDRKAEDTFEDVTYVYENGGLIPHDESSPPYDDNLIEGDIEADHFILKHPFILEEIQINFMGPGGKVRIAVFEDLARSWPWADTSHYYPQEEKVAANIEAEVPDDAGWVTFKLDPPVIRLPHEHFWIGYVHINKNPYLALGQSTPDFELSQSMYYSDQHHDSFIWDPGRAVYMIRAKGKHFCKVEKPWFKDITESAGLKDLTHMRVAFGDVDGDKYDDLLLHLPNDGSIPDGATLFRNKHYGTFEDITEQAGLLGHYSALGAIADFDNDGDEDIYLGVYVSQSEGFVDPGFRSVIMENDGDGVFTVVEDSGVGLEATTSAAAVADFNKDSYLDIFAGNWLLVYPNPESFCDFLFKNNGDLTFTDVSDMLTDQQCRPCYGAEWADYDNNGKIDLFVANYGREDSYLWENRGDKFVDVAPQKGVNKHGSGTSGNAFSADFADYDSDGDLDLYVADIAHPRYQPSSDPSSFNVNSGSPDFKFTDMRDELEVPWDEGEIEVSFIDFDNDGRLDLMLSDLYPVHFSRLFRQKEDGTFEDVTYLAGLVLEYATNHAWSDIDRDGDLDLAITHNGGSVMGDTENKVRLFRNDIGNKNHWIAVKLEGVDSNRDAVGARVYLTACGGKTQMREIKSARGHFSSQSTLVAHFGLGDCTDIDKLEVKWPTGERQSFSDVEPDKYYILEEGSGLTVWD